MDSPYPAPDTGHIIALDTAAVSPEAPEPDSPLVRDLLAVAQGQQPQDSEALETAAAGSHQMAVLLTACRAIGSLGGGSGGDRLARILAQGYSALAIADLAARAQATRGRDADRLWRPVLAAAGLDARPQGPGGQVVQISAAQVSVALLQLSPQERAALAALALEHQRSSAS